MSIMDLFKKKTPSSSVAKGRLQLALVSDRTGCSPEIMDQIKNDIIAVISKYVEIDAEGLDINFTQTRSESTGEAAPVLLANIPIKEVKRSRQQ